MRVRRARAFLKTETFFVLLCLRKQQLVRNRLIWCRIQEVYRVYYSSMEAIMSVLETISNGSAVPRVSTTQMADIGNQKC